MFNLFRILISFQSPLVVQKLIVSDKSEKDPKSIIYINARKGGLIAFVLTILGLSSLYELKVNKKEVKYNERSIFGFIIQTIPLSSVSNVVCTMQLPIFYLFFAVLFIFCALYLGLVRDTFIGFFISLLICIVFIFLFIFGKRFSLQIYSNSGPPVVMVLKPGIIGSTPLDGNKLSLIATLIRNLVYNLNVGAISDNQEVISDVQAEAEGGYEVIQPETEVASYESYSPAPEVSETTNPFAWSAYQSQPAPIAYNSPPSPAQETPEQAAERLLAEARALKQANRREEVIERLRQIVHYYPQTQAAQKARQILEKAGISV